MSDPKHVAYIVIRRDDARTAPSNSPDAPMVRPSRDTLPAQIARQLITLLSGTAVHNPTTGPPPTFMEIRDEFEDSVALVHGIRGGVVADLVEQILAVERVHDLVHSACIEPK